MNMLSAGRYPPPQAVRLTRIGVIAGLLLASVLVLLFCLTLLSHMERVQSRRQGAAMQAQQRYDCAVRAGGLRRDRCLAAPVPMRRE